MIYNLVLAGSQLKGLAYIGTLRALEELKLTHTIKNICGVSSGAIFGLLIFLGLNYERLFELAIKICKYDLIRSTEKINISNILELYGIESGENIKKILRVVLETKTKKKDCTFRDLEEVFPEKTFIVVGTNVTENITEYFSKDTTPYMKIIDAIRISISIPMIFTKQEYKNNLYVDGGIGCNIPMDYFKNDIEHTLGICVSSPNYLTDITSVESYMFRIFRILLDNIDNYIIERYRDNIVEILVDYNYLNIDINEDKTRYLINAGYEQFKTEIYKTRFSDYLEINSIINSLITNIENRDK